MSEAAETLDGWYSLHLFYAVDWTTFRLIAEDDREAMITELETFIKDYRSKSGPFTMVFTSRNERVKSN